MISVAILAAVRSALRRVYARVRKVYNRIETDLDRESPRVAEIPSARHSFPRGFGPAEKQPLTAQAIYSMISKDYARAHVVILAMW